MTEFCHYQFYTNFALKNMHTKQSQGREGKSTEGERSGGEMWAADGGRGGKQGE